MTLTVSASQISNATYQVTWGTDDPDPVAGFEIAIDIDGAGYVELATLSGTARTYLDVSGLWTPGQSIQYRVTDLDTATAAATPLVTANDLTEPWTYGPVDPLADTIRYTSLDAVKRALGIPATDVTKDDDLTEAAIAAEVATDVELGRSFPDAGVNPQIQGIPIPMTTVKTK